MPFGYSGKIIRINLTTGEITKLEMEEDFYRIYMGGSNFGAYFLLKETDGDTDALSEDNILTISPSVTTGALISGVSRCCITSLSPETGAVGDTQVGGKIGPAIKQCGYDAIVIKGKSAKLSYILMDEEKVEIRDASFLKGKTILEVYDILASKHGKDNLSILQCGPAGEKRVRFACLIGDLNNTAGRTGMGAVFGSKNLRAIVFKGKAKLNFADKEGIRKLALLASKRIKTAEFPLVLHKYGTPGVFGFQANSGNIATHNYSCGFHPDFKNLDGKSFEPLIGAGHTTCPGCIIACRKKVKVDKPYQVTNRLGGPEFETLVLLGTNLEITDPIIVAKANELCNNYGIDTISMGSIASYLFESIENGLVSAKIVGNRKVGFKNPQSIIWLIEKVAKREGVGDVLAEGFNYAIGMLGKKTAKFAMQSKNHALPAHMPQVKPSQAIMYAVCPIGADHMSSEHDWLLEQSESCRGLGIFGEGDRNSVNLAKVRMTVYSQFYYSLLDTLCLCMFCWGPGNLFLYRELEDLLRFTTGWECTFWELMKVGERRINMMRQLNSKRGFSKKNDLLPARINLPLPSGPSKGKHIKKKDFNNMLKLYFELMGWDKVSGNPTAGKLKELGLEWTI